MPTILYVQARHFLEDVAMSRCLVLPLQRLRSDCTSGKNVLLRSKAHRAGHQAEDQRQRCAPRLQGGRRDRCGHFRHS